MKKFFKRTGLLLAAAFIGAAAMQAQKSPQDMDRFIDALMKRMTVEEKIGQLNLPVTGEITTGQAKSSDVAKKIEQGLVGGLFNLKGVDKIRDVQKLAVENSRLSIPLLFGMDVIHGYETIFPIPLGLSCTWDMAAIRESARIAAIEASADGISWTFSPMVDISRDPRWGRVSEGSGEDPFLGGAIAKAMVYGYQGANLSDQLKRNDEILACVKHFALYGAGEAGRDYNTVDMSRNRMFNEYMYPYEAAVEAGVGSVMASFNEIDGVPATANKWLMTDVLRKQWGFNGFVVTDFTGISEMTEHGIGDLQAVSARALNAGVDMDMVSEGFVGTLKKSVMSGKVSMKTLDTACRRILEAKYKLGLFDNPYKYCDPERPARDIFTREHRAAARRKEQYSLLDMPLGRRASLYIATHSTAELTAASVAEAVSSDADETALNHALLIATGLNFSQYVNRVRLILAMSYFLYDSLPFDYVSSISGFHMSITFFRRFKALTGMTPQGYLNDMLSDGKDGRVYRGMIMSETLISAISYLYENMSEPIDAEKIARDLYTSENILRVQLKTRLNSSYKQILSMFRVRYAEALLTTTELPTVDIAMETGFGSDRTMGRVFYALNKMSPGEFRKQRGQGRKQHG